MHPPDEGRSNAEDHRTSFVASVPVVVHITYDPAVGSDYRACSGGGHSQEEHRLAAQELSYTGTQDLTAISLSVEEKRTFFFSQCSAKKVHLIAKYCLSSITYALLKQRIKVFFMF